MALPTNLSAAGIIMLLLALAPTSSRSEDSSAATPDSTIDTTAEAPEPAPRRKLVKWNEYDGPVTTVRLGIGFLYDFATFAQDDESKQQLEMEPGHDLRDFRFIFGGRFKTERPLSWTVGYMYDGKDDEWRFRKSGLQIGVPELSGQFFVGRDKEGYSMVKVMNGYHPWGMERSPGMDAFIPILADGVRYMGYYPAPRVFVNLGWFTDTLSENEGFSTYDNQAVARIGWLPILSEESKQVLHVAAMVRDAEPDDGMLQVRSKPENNLAPYVVDTGKFPADHVTGTRCRGVLPEGPVVVRRRIRLAGCLPGNRRKRALSRGQPCRCLAHHRRNARLQHGRRILQCGVPEAPGVRRRTRSVGGSGHRLLHRLGLRNVPRREVLASDADGQLALVRQPAAGVRLWIWRAGSLRPRGRNSVLPIPFPTVPLIDSVRSSLGGIAIALRLATGFLVGCGPSEEETSFLAQRALLQRQNQGIGELIAEAEAGSLVPVDRFLVGIDEKVLAGLLRSQLPFEHALGKRLVVHLDSATVRLRDKYPLITIEGNIHRRATPQHRTAVRAIGGLGTVQIDPATDLLSMTIAIDDVELLEAGLLDQVLGSEGKKLVSEKGRAILQEELPILHVPVALAQNIRIPAIQEGSIELDSLVVPLDLSVERVLAAGGKLWLTLNAKVGKVEGGEDGVGIAVKK